MKESKKKNRILIPILIAVMFVALLLSLRWAIMPYTVTHAYVEHTHDLEKAGKNSDMIFIGASRTYRGFDPEVFEKELGLENVLNDGTPAQRMIFSYYMLKDTFEHFQPKYVILGATYNGLLYKQVPENFVWGMDRLSLSNRLECANKIYGLGEGLMVVAGKSEFIKDSNWANIFKNIYRKIGHRSQDLSDDTQICKVNGYVGSYKTMPQGGIDLNFEKDRGFDESKITDETMEYFDKTVKLCKENNAKLILVSGICSLGRMYSIENYQAVTDYYNKLADKYDLKYYNLNYIKDREELFPDTVFIDDQHLNFEGGQRQSEIFAKILKDEFAGKDTSHYFYKNLEDLSKDVHRIAGHAIDTSVKEDEVTIKTKTYQNKNVVPQQRVLGIDENGRETVLKDWTDQKTIKLSLSNVKNYYNLRVQFRTGEPGETYGFSDVKVKDLFLPDV